MINISLAIWMLFVHWFADFVCQDDETAINKSKSDIALMSHTGIYFGVLLIGIILYSDFFAFPLSQRLLIILNFPAHFITDRITSRINAKLYLASKRHWFFVMIGFDQFLHFAVLFLTLGN